MNTYQCYFKGKGKGKWEYCSALNVGIKNSKNVAVFTEGSAVALQVPPTQ